jgi:pimeloyl-ACP methyl ester carboxylesterase
VTDVSDDELAGIDEFALLTESAVQAGVTGPLPDVARLDCGPISALRWGCDAPRIVFLHGGAQNAHTWDAVILGLGQPALAVDLPGHGRSAWREDGDYSPRRNAEALTPILRHWAPEADLVVGMSLGGMTAIGIAAAAPELVRRLALVDVTPSASLRRSQMTDAQKGTTALSRANREFPSFRAMLDAATAAAPHRDWKSLRRGVFHNSVRLEDGTWTWRYDTIRADLGFEEMWDDVPLLTMPTTLVRGGDSVFVTDEDAERLARIAPGFTGVRVVPDSGHSVQGDQPRTLVNILRDLLTI